LKNLDTLHFNCRDDFRKWLELNHDKSHGFWMIFYKSQKKRENITYEEALEEAICFGWIDSIVKKIDDEIYIRKFTPRIDFKNWSDANIKRVVKLIENGRMNEAGLNKIDVNLNILNKDKDDQPNINLLKNKIEIPDFILEEFTRNEPALINFMQFSPSYKRNYIQWIMNASREETRYIRIKESIKLLKENKKLGLK
jgi:uncharacterized protein YdeI (YjbR/CyaY-like superfamily)